MAGDDRLSNLSDDLLRCILHFAPAKEGAATSALARRWRSLWLSSGAVNLDSRSYDHLDDHDKRDVIVRDASKALAAAGGRGRPVTKFTFRYVEGEDDPWILLRKNDIEDAKHHMSGDLRATLYSQASRHLEELRLGLFFGPRSDGPRDLYSFSIPSLSSAPALRVLHVSKCLEWDWDRLCPSRPASVTPPFPRLLDLRLHQCSVSLSILQAVIDAAPLLATLQLDGVEFRLPALPSATQPPAARSILLRVPKVTAIVLENMHCWGHQGQNTMELDAPLLRCFAYRGAVRSLSLRSPPPDMTRVDLSFQVPSARVDTDDTMCRLFWNFVRNFYGANTISLKFQLSQKACLGDLCF
ncbi:hypothetical protein CFC21_110215 [Triticum aestivum]|uniref:F-box/LRR-repeat protein 15/At3g58940/PEG3-like LRR domain-containing protein n=2 Tax=Triticum aestivum TaxID=4565 RepID=A0A9R1NDR4_WHEAT|nr:hypothetical protein CFC21_110215 [Triticum aestivum]